MKGLLVVTGAWEELLKVNPETHQRDMGTIIFEGFQIAACDHLSYGTRYLEYAEGERVRLTFSTEKLMIYTKMLTPAKGFDVRLIVEEANMCRPSSTSFNVEWVKGIYNEERFPWVQNYLDLRIYVQEIESPIGTFAVPIDVDELLELNTLHLQDIYDDCTQKKFFPVDCIKMHVIPIEEVEEDY